MLFLLASLASAQDNALLDGECSPDGYVEVCDDGACESVDLGVDVATATATARKKSSRPAPKTATPSCPDPDAPKPAGLLGDPPILGALDKSLIDAVIKRNMSQIRYCYTRASTQDPSLGHGRLAVRFTVQKDGTVERASMSCSDLDNQEFEDCVAGRFGKFQFPKPKGGGIVIVKYPFMF